ncbi:MAG: serine protease [Gemmatimonadetes bacterium]|nr:serine protease [Gemmatimonadota bacterium]
MSEIEKRRELLQQIESHRNSKAVLYVTGDRQGLETMIGQDVIDLFVDHLDEIGPVTKISLVLYTSGGSTSAAWNLVNLLQMFCDDFEVIAPGKCMSAGTLISLGADRVVMTKQATLGPIDPSIQHPLGPSIPGASPEARAGVSVEAVEGYLDAIRKCQAGEVFEGQALMVLSEQVHPLVLGQIFRSRQQIRDLAGRLLQKHTDKKDQIDQIVDFLCSESGSHDYTINRREAKRLGLNVEKCSEELYVILRQLHNNFSTQMSLREPYDINTLAADGNTGKYEFTRALIESVDCGAHHFISAGEIETTEIIQQDQEGVPLKQIAIQDQRKFEGWRKIT